MSSDTVYREEYVRETGLVPGWLCHSTVCSGGTPGGVFNGDAKEFRLTCRCCGSPRPRVEHVVRGTHGKH
jgi:hypothetical protein